MRSRPPLAMILSLLPSPMRSRILSACPEPWQGRLWHWMIWPAARAAAPTRGTIITTTRAIISLRGMHLSSPIASRHGRVRPLPIFFSVDAASAPCPQRPLEKAVRRLDEPAQGDADALAVADGVGLVEAVAGFGRIRFAP